MSEVPGSLSSHAQLIAGVAFHTECTPIFQNCYSFFIKLLYCKFVRLSELAERNGGFIVSVTAVLKLRCKEAFEVKVM